MLTVGHRGASALAPENTLRAFELAIEHSLDMAELDVHLSRDSQLMVIHDADLQRVASRPDRVADLTARELRALDVPTLTDVFDVARGRLGIYVELKGQGTGAALGDLLGTGAAEGVTIIGGSFIPSLVADLARVAPDTPRSILFSRTTLQDMLSVCAAHGATYAHPCFRPVDKAMVNAFHETALLVMTPHTNDADEARVFARIGVDVIASDDPRILVGLSA